MSSSPKSLKEIFLEIAQPDDQGISREVTVEELLKVDSRFAMGNGGSWCRSDGPLKDFVIERRKKGNRIIAVKLEGRSGSIMNRQIRSDIVREIRMQACAVLAVNSENQVDHKNGRYNDPRVNNVATQQLDDFQSLSRAANTAKRQHCKECKASGVRFDAKRLGYRVGQWRGGTEYTGSCVGCFWYDPVEFNNRISEGFKKD